MAKRGGFPGGMPGNMNNLNETGAENAASDGREQQNRLKKQRVNSEQPEAELLK